MDLGITNIFIFYLRSWLILSIEISQPSFDHTLTLDIDLTAPVWVNQYKRNREFGSIHSSKVHDTFHVSKNLIKTSYYYIRSKSLIAFYSAQRTHTRSSSSGYEPCNAKGNKGPRLPCIGPWWQDRNIVFKFTTSREFLPSLLTCVLLCPSLLLLLPLCCMLLLLVDLS